MITTQDIEKLAALSRLKIDDKEKEGLAKDIGAILSYVDQLKKVTASRSGERIVGVTKNVLREDVVSHIPGSYTEDLLNLAPKKDGQFVKVKKIL
jgi:aspartyl/glutamyl-tRNA(Asn/Gln) amidotransferase C subunit